MKIIKGTTRLVLVTKYFVIKVPNFTYSQQNFLSGCLANYNERWFCRKFKMLPEIELVAKTYFTSWFGLFNIQERVFPLDYDIKEYPEIKETYKHVCKDFKSDNFGETKTGTTVCLDYG